MLRDQYLRSIEYKPDLEVEVLQELIDKIREIPLALEDIETKVSESTQKFSHYLVNIEEFGEAIKKRAKRYSKKTIVVDELGFYVPYHYDLNRYGIYFRVKNLLRDFYELFEEVQRLLKDTKVARILSDESEANLIKLNKARKSPVILRNSLFIEFLVFNYARFMAHHVFEDIGLILEFLGKGKYSILNALAENSYCEYVAYTTLERYMPGVLQRSKKAERLITIFYPFIEGFRWDQVMSLNFATTKLIYLHNLARGRTIPRIGGKVRLKVEVLFRALWKLHYTFEEEIHALKAKPIIQRIYVTTL